MADNCEKIIKIDTLRQATVIDALERSMEVAKRGKIKRVAILMRFDGDNEDEVIGFLVGKDNPGQYTNALLVWDLEQTKVGLFQGCFEED
jgi:hypothetical protein